MNTPITQTDVLAYFKYVNGRLFWKKSSGRNAVVGNPADSSINKSGYRLTGFRKQRFATHRLIFFMHHGYWPRQVDHIDRDKLNNRIENLRECTLTQNVANQDKTSRNTSGFRGVTWNKQKKKWQAGIAHGGKYKNLGYFRNKEDAAAARVRAAIALHGIFASERDNLRLLDKES